jgi:hypothetical protein
MVINCTWEGDALALSDDPLGSRFILISDERVARLLIDSLKYHFYIEDDEDQNA